MLQLNYWRGPIERTVPLAKYSPPSLPRIDAPAQDSSVLPAWSSECRCFTL